MHAIDCRVVCTVLSCSVDRSEGGVHGVLQCTATCMACRVARTMVTSK